VPQAGSVVKARIVHVAADGEVIQQLEGEVLEAEHLVHRIVEEAADAGRAHAGACRLSYAGETGSSSGPSTGNRVSTAPA
jgi:hypothetical protein